MRLPRSFRLRALVGFIILFVIVQFLLSLLLHPPDALLLTLSRGESLINGLETHSSASKTSDVVYTCNLTTLPRDAQDAFSRAKTTSCRQRIVDTACSAQNSTLFSTHTLQRTCPSQKDAEFFVHLGCYNDNVDDRDLNGGVTVNKETNNALDCVHRCLQEGHAYAGVQYGIECWCGSQYGRHGKAANEMCNVKCPLQNTASLQQQNGVQYCGGYRTQNIYSTGVGNKMGFKPAYTEPRAIAPHKRIRIAYVLTLNGRNYRQVLRLFKRIYHVNHYYLIHVDQRADFLLRKLSFLESLFSNVRFSPIRFAPIWGGTSLLTALLGSMRELIDGSASSWHWTYLINLSESDYPLKTDDELSAFLSQNEPFNFVRSHGTQTSTFIKKQGLAYTFLECDEHMFRLGERPLPRGLRVDGGSDWVVLHHRFVHYLIDLLFGHAVAPTTAADAAQPEASLVREIYHWFNYTLLPAEAFFHYVLLNTRFCTEAVFDNNLRFTNWRRSVGCNCQYKRIVDWCGCSPNIIRNTELPNLLENVRLRPIYFARKFDSVIDLTTLNRVDQYLDTVMRRIDNGFNVSSLLLNASIETKSLDEVHDDHAGHDHGDVEADVHSRSQLAASFWYSLFQIADSVRPDFTVDLHLPASDSDSPADLDEPAKRTKNLVVHKVDVASNYDSHATMSQALMRLAIAELHAVAAHCEFIAVRPLELTLYRVSDALEGVLLKFEAFVEQRSQHHDHADPQLDNRAPARHRMHKRARQPEVLEAWFRPDALVIKSDAADLPQDDAVVLSHEHDEKPRPNAPDETIHGRKVMQVDGERPHQSYEQVMRNAHMGDKPQTAAESRVNVNSKSKSDNSNNQKPNQPVDKAKQKEAADNRKGEATPPLDKEAIMTAAEARHCLDRFESIEAGTNFDRKEAALRGTPGLLSVFSDIQILHRWHVAKQECIVRFVLFDPTDSPRNSEVHSVPSDTAHADVYAPTLVKPMLPGYWTLLIIGFYKQSDAEAGLRPVIIANYRFLVSPHTYFNGSPLDLLPDNTTDFQQRFVDSVNAGPSAGEGSPEAALRRFENLLSNAATRASRQEEATERAQVRGEELLSWTQSLYSNAFKFRAACVFEVDASSRGRQRSFEDKQSDAEEDEEFDSVEPYANPFAFGTDNDRDLREGRADPNRNRVCADLDWCQRTLWSSFAPDEKSELGPINPRTGRLV